MAEQLITKLKELNQKHRDFIEKSMVKVKECVRRACLQAARQGLCEAKIEDSELCGEISQRNLNDQDFRQFVKLLKEDNEFLYIEVQFSSLTVPIKRVGRKTHGPDQEIKRSLLLSWK